MPRAPRAAEDATFLRAALAPPSAASRERRTNEPIPPVRKGGYPARLLFFDSESYVGDATAGFRLQKKTDTVSTDVQVPGDETVFIPHTPRLICAEYWERAEDGSYVARPLPEGDGAFREGDYDGPAALCDGFWDAAFRLAERSEHGRGRTTLTVFAHNVGYDLLATGVLPRLRSRGWEAEHPYAKGPIFIMRARKGRHTLLFLSSTNFFVSTLAKLGEAFGLPKLDPGEEGFNTSDVRRLETYCRRDVEIVRHAVLWLIGTLEREDIGPWRMTIASLSFAAWRYRFMGHDVYLHDTEGAVALERASYCGGRTEAFYLGERTGYTVDLDVNNLYGFVMHSAQVPCHLRRFQRGGLTVLDLESLLDAGAAVIAEVKVEVRDPVVPLKDEKLLFPVGRFYTTLCSPELNLARQHGRILEVAALAVYDTAPLFHEAVEYYSRKRMEAKRAGHEALYRLYKDLCNQLYGKFGQMQETWERVGDTPEGMRLGREVFVLPDNRIVVFKVLPTGIFRSDGQRTEAFYAFPAIASFITSYARVHLWRMKSIAEGDDGRHVLYCDTDSLFVDRAGFRRLQAAEAVNDLVLGKMKIEWEADVVRIGGAKWYEVTTTEGKAIAKHKGVPLKARLVETEKGPRFAYEQFPGMDGLLAANLGVGAFANRRVLKKTTVDYTKGTRDADGWVHPHRLTQARATDP